MKGFIRGDNALTGRFCFHPLFFSFLQSGTLCNGMAWHGMETRVDTTQATRV